MKWNASYHQPFKFGKSSPLSLVHHVQSTGREFHVPLYFTLQRQKWGDRQVKTNPELSEIVDTTPNCVQYLIEMP
jgi:hypothetical protein